MGKYQGYQKYKDSGVEWLGEIPEHWKFKRIKFIGKIKYGLGEPPEKLDDGLPIIRATDIFRGVIDGSKVQRVNPDKVPWSRNPELKTGDILVVRSGAYTGDSAIVPNEWAGSIAGYDMVLTPIQAHPKYIAWNLLGRHILEGQLYLAKSRAAQPHLNAEELGNTILTIPPLDEQEKIARFLDYKTKQIDDLIAKKETLIEKLDEKRTALISHAVTKGIDPSVPMKDSGIEWLGEIPEYWKAVRLKHITSRIIDGAHFTPTYVDEGIPFLRVTDIVQAKNNSIDMNNIKFIPEEEHKILSIRCKPEQGDLLYSKNGTIGVSRIIDWDFEFSIFVSLCLIKLTKEKVNVEFLQYSLLGKLTETQISIGAKSNTVTNLHLDKIKEFLISLPTLDEQRKIIQYLDQKTAKIDQQKAKIKEAIELLKEYRTALITNAVTGKIDVRQVLIP